MSAPHLPQPPSNVQDKDVFLHLKEIIIIFDDDRRPDSDLILVLKDKDKKGFRSKSNAFKKNVDICWEAGIYVKACSEAELTIRQGGPINRDIAKFNLCFNADGFEDERAIEQRDDRGKACSRIIFGPSRHTVEIVRVLGDQASFVLASKVSMLNKLDILLKFLDFFMVAGGVSELNTTAKAVVSIVNKFLSKLRDITTCHKQFVDIMNDLVSMLPLMGLALERLHDAECLALIQSFLAFVFETSNGLIEYASRSSADFLFRNWFNSKKDEVLKLKDRSTHLKLNMSVAIGVDTRGAVSDIRTRQMKEEQARVLRRIKPPQLSSFDPERCCMPGTRISILEAVKSFALSNDQPARLYWLYGIAGSGKSSVAASIALALDTIKRLSGSFFCKRDVPELRSPIRLIHALAYSIAEVHVPYRNALMKVLEEDSRLEDKALALQFDTLLRGPFYKVSQELPAEAVIFVADALDECDDSRSISIFLAQVVELAPWLRLVVTSRPLPEIEHGLRTVEDLMLYCDLFNQDAHRDIELFICWQFSMAGPLYDLQPYMDDVQIESLSQKSAGLFIWIATVLLHISRLLFGKHAALLDIISSGNAAGPEAQLDVLYLQVLKSVTGSSASNREAVKTIIALIYVTSRNQALPSTALHAFILRAGIRVSQQELDNFLRQMGSVLTTDTKTGAIRVCHPSFLDFIGNVARSQDFWMSTKDIDAMMAKECFEIMQSGLMFNICGLKSATLRNDEVWDLEDRIVRHVSKKLQYSCIYWHDHLSRSSDTCKEKMLGIVERFLHHRISLYWLEVLSLISKLQTAYFGLLDLRLMYKGATNLRDCALDYCRFVNMFHEPMSISTPHIYISALVWTPSSSPIPAALFYPQSLVLEGREKDWPMGLQVLKCEDKVMCVDLSPDGSRIVSGFEGGLIRIWDAVSGAPIGAPLKGHMHWVTSVAYSPDGSRIVSGSDDRTIRIWDARSGAPSGTPLVGHTNSVTSVAYSPDGLRIASGSDDKMIRIWDARSGAPIGAPLQGHTSFVKSVAYSPDGSRIVSGSWDETICIWDARSGAPIGAPLVGHTNSVTSVAYSPDGLRIASGSDDKTLRIWDAPSGAPIGAPLQGHTDPVTSVAYSPDGLRMVSGSDDKMIRIWDARSGAPIGAPLQGHTSFVKSVAYSPDGSRIVSGSWDETIRIWDARSGAPIGVPLVGHTDIVTSVAYSPDGSRIVSGSDDKTIRIWDARSGAPIGTPLLGHANWVTSVAYSPDGLRIVS